MGYPTAGKVFPSSSSPITISDQYHNIRHPTNFKDRHCNQLVCSNESLANKQSAFVLVAACVRGIMLIVMLNDLDYV
jgi:hypothetical protein